MQQQYKFVCLLLLFISEYQTQELTTDTTLIPTTTLPDWYGDPSICTINQPTTPSPEPPQQLPKFTTQAEFTQEFVIHDHRLGIPNSNELILQHCIYDYDNNKLTLVEQKNNNINVQFFEYEILKRAIYNRDTCDARIILQDVDTGMFILEFLKILCILIIRW